MAIRDFQYIQKILNFPVRDLQDDFLKEKFL